MNRRRKKEIKSHLGNLFTPERIWLTPDEVEAEVQQIVEGIHRNQRRTDRYLVVCLVQFFIILALIIILIT